MTDKPKARPIEIVQNEYQPTKAEQEEEVVLRNADGSIPEPADIMRALTRPVDITYIEKPRKR